MISLGLCSRAVAATASLDKTRAIRIWRDPSAENVDLVTDTDRLSQVFINLITNAQKYCDADDPVLEISVTREEDRLAIRFADNGTPLPEDKLSVIFEKFEVEI